MAPELCSLEFVNGGNEMNLMETMIEPMVGGALQFSVLRAPKTALWQNHSFGHDHSQVVMN